MKGVAVNKLPEKVFAVFAAYEIRDDSPLFVEPSSLMYLSDIPGVHVVPWHGDSIEIPLLESAEIVQPILDRVNAAVAEVEAHDPWVLDEFGVDGVGEGLVYYPLGVSRKMFADLCFKAKGEKHKIVAKSQPAQIDPVVASSVDAFVAMVLTDARLEQGARAASGGDLSYEKRFMGSFLAWICKDVEKETGAEREVSGLEWRQVQRSVSDRARRWYIARAEMVV